MILQNSLKTERLFENKEETISTTGGIICTRVLDSKEAGSTWHRMSVAFKPKRGSMLRVSIYASDSNLLAHKNHVKTIDEVLCLSDGEERDGFLRDAFVKSCDNPSDILLHDVVGRYLWCIIEILGNGAVELSTIYVSSPAQTFLNYLPEIYQDKTHKSFADKYLSVFQALYEDFEYEILHSPALYDADSAPDNLVLQMAEWFGVEDTLIWAPKQLRAVLKNTHFLHKMRGTMAALSLLIEIFCGAKAYFVETFHAMRYYLGIPDLRRLYLDDRFSLYVAVFKNLSQHAENALRHLIQKNKPAHVNAHLVVLKPLIVLNSYTYLGINSVLSSCPAAALDGGSMFGYSAIKLGGE